MAKNNKCDIEFGCLIREAREFQNITQVRMAQKLNVARQTYIDIENGKVVPRADVIQLIAKILKKHISYFYGEISIDHPYIDHDSAQAIRRFAVAILSQVERN